MLIRERNWCVPSWALGGSLITPNPLSCATMDVCVHTCSTSILLSSRSSLLSLVTPLPSLETSVWLSIKSPWWAHSPAWVWALMNFELCGTVLPSCNTVSWWRDLGLVAPNPLSAPFSHSKDPSSSSCPYLCAEDPKEDFKCWASVLPLNYIPSHFPTFRT